MSFDHLGAVAELILPPTQKLVLFALGNRACATCGIAWPGKPYLIEMTGLGHTAVVAALKALVDSGYVVIHRYSHGGRGVATEYVVLPNVLSFSKKAPCAECSKRMKTPRQADGLSRGGENPPPGGRFRGQGVVKPSAGGGQNGPPGVHHSVSNTLFSQNDDPQPSASGSASPRSSDSQPPPTTIAEDARRRADAQMRAIIAAGPRSPKPRDPEKPQKP